MLKFIKRMLHKETGDEMRERINRQIREYNKVGISSIKFTQGKNYE